nr:DUF1764 domain-containing protein [Ipomoea batatas]
MKKKNQSKNAKPVEQNPVAANVKKPLPIISSATPKKQKPGSDIDEIFPHLKSKNLAVISMKSLRGKRERNRRRLRMWLESLKKGSRKRTGDGLAIYTEKELGIDKADVGGAWEGGGAAGGVAECAVGGGVAGTRRSVGDSRDGRWVLDASTSRWRTGGESRFGLCRIGMAEWEWEIRALSTAALDVCICVSDLGKLGLWTTGPEVKIQKLY